MSRLAPMLLLALLGAACGGPSIFDVSAAPGENDCAGPGPDQMAYGRDPLSGRCVSFPSRCDVPAEWATWSPCS